MAQEFKWRRDLAEALLTQGNAALMSLKRIENGEPVITFKKKSIFDTTIETKTNLADEIIESHEGDANKNDVIRYYKQVSQAYKDLRKFEVKAAKGCVFFPLDRYQLEDLGIKNLRTILSGINLAMTIYDQMIMREDCQKAIQLETTVIKAIYNNLSDKKFIGEITSDLPFEFPLERQPVFQ